MSTIDVVRGLMTFGMFRRQLNHRPFASANEEAHLILEGNSLLLLTLVYRAAGVISVPITQRFGMGSVLGYLIAGVVIGPFALHLVGDQTGVRHFAEFGIVIMLFLVGLEVRPWLCPLSVVHGHRRADVRRKGPSPHFSWCGFVRDPAISGRFIHSDVSRAAFARDGRRRTTGRACAAWAVGSIAGLDSGLGHSGGRELEGDIEPFRGLLLGLFFISIGASLNLGLLAAQPVTLLTIVAGLMAIKMAVVFMIGRTRSSRALVVSVKSPPGC